MNQQFLEAISIFVFMYPAGMAIYWVSASLCYYLFMEGKLGQPTFQQMPQRTRANGQHYGALLQRRGQLR